MSENQEVKREHPLTVYLNRPALERLIGGDTELEVRLRHQVCEQFAEKHLKAVINDAAYQETMKAMRVALMGVIEAEVGRVKGYYEMVDVNQTTQDKIRRKVQEVVDTSVDAAIERKLQERAARYQDSWAALVMQKVEEAMTQNVKRLVDEEFAKRSAKIKAALEGR